jgi:hypothetical protein
MKAVAGTASGKLLAPVSSRRRGAPVGISLVLRVGPATRAGAWIPTLASLVREDKAVPVAAVIRPIR